MADYSGGEVTGIITGALAALTTLAIGVREYLKREKVSTAQDNSTVKGISANDTVIANMQVEMQRLTKIVEKMQRQINRLTGKLASVRMVAIDCYALANECDCTGENRRVLLAHLKTIITDDLKNAEDEEEDAEGGR